MMSDDPVSANSCASLAGINKDNPPIERIKQIGRLTVTYEDWR